MANHCLYKDHQSFYDFLDNVIKDIHDFSYILKRMRVPYERRVTEDNSFEEVLVRGVLIFSEGTTSHRKTAWLKFDPHSSQITTTFESWLADEEITISQVISFCEEYHRRSFFLKERKAHKMLESNP